MKEELSNVPVLAMYDVRGIQEYIFRTNRVKEIIGASCIVDDIIKNTLAYVAKYTNGLTTKNVIMDWEPDKNKINNERKELLFLYDESIEIQVLFIGGGNAYVLYRTGDLCEKINKQMSKKILIDTYSLQLAIAVVKKSDSYQKDLKDLRNEMEKVKAEMQVARTFGALPICKIDNITGFPLIEHNDFQKREEMSRETLIKRIAETKVKEEEDIEAQKKGRSIERRFDELVTMHEEDSMLAIVHIDGNNMGKRIGDILNNQEGTYEKAIETMRTISYNINHSFKEEVFERMQTELEDWIQRNGYIDRNNYLEDKKSAFFQEGGTYLRKIIVAGDDVTFVCNAKLAFVLVQYFAKKVSQYTMYGEEKREEKREDSKGKYAFSICAGIAYINSHFPFHIGYQVAEECCANAKRKAREVIAKMYDGESDENSDQMGNWVDFQICRNAQMGDLSGAREKHYNIDKKYCLIQRPYYIPVEGESFRYLNTKAEMETYNFNNLVNQIQQLKEYSKSKVMLLRNTYPLGKIEMDTVVSFLKSRKGSSDTKIPDFLENTFMNNRATYYDALEMYDYCEMIALGEGK